MVEEELIQESRSSIELAKNSKGYTHKIKLYFSENLEAQRIVKQLEELNKQMNEKFA